MFHLFHPFYFFHSCFIFDPSCLFLSFLFPLFHPVRTFIPVSTFPSYLLLSFLFYFYHSASLLSFLFNLFHPVLLSFLFHLSSFHPAHFFHSCFIFFILFSTFILVKSFPSCSLLPFLFHLLHSVH